MRKLLVAAAAFAVLALALVPHRAPSLADCESDAARNLMATNLMDALLNPTKQEDNEFFTNSGSVPNLMFVVDTSGSMERLPPDGPGSLGAVSKTCSQTSDCGARYACVSGRCKPTLPGTTLRWFGVTYDHSSLVYDVSGNDQDDAFASTTRIVGCDDDATFEATENVGNNPMIVQIKNRVFSTACGSASDSTALNEIYRGHPGVTGGLDYADQAKVCPYYDSSNSQATGHAGFDPDFYPASPGGTETTANGRPVFFARDLVFHDDAYQTATGGSQAAYATASTAFGHNFGNGWSGGAVYPASYNGNAKTPIEQFCATQSGSGSALQGGRTRAEICTACLQKKGWYWDGVILHNGEGYYPSIWYTGNYLNFYPPKFLTARKIVKDVVSVQSKIRMALAQFVYSDTKKGITIPKEFNPSCDHPDSSFDSNRGAYVNAVNAFTFGGGTPLSSALFDVGRYYHSPGLPWFGSDWDDTATTSPSNKNSYSICYSCQTSSVVLITDGEPSPGDGNGLPSGATTAADANGKYAGDTGTGIRGIDATTCPECANFTGTDDYRDRPAKVAWYMHNLDLRDNAEETRDCRSNGGKQALNVYTVGFATGQLPDANKILAATAKVGGGLFVQADNPQVLRSGLNSIMEDINTRSTSFSVATVSTLQTTSGRAVIVPRFEPNKTSTWRGHLMRYDLYSEFVNACDPKADGTGTGDLDCDGQCTSVFVQDKPALTNGTPGTPSFITEDGSGNFVKSTTASLPVCAQAPKCKTTTGKSCSTVSATAATPWWDAGALLAGTTATQKWKTRRIFTQVDQNGNGAIDAGDGDPIQLAATDTVAGQIAPYLGLGAGNACDQLGARFDTAGDLAHGTSVRTTQLECAKAFIRLVLGADLFNSQGKKTGYPVTDLDTLWDRDWVLGDIFHSSPVVVDPPLPRDGVICPNGLSNQCLPSLWGTPTPNGKVGYDGYAKSSTYVNRNKIVLVGANDGLLHAFQAGSWHGNSTPGTHNDAADDPYTTGLDESLPPFGGYYDRGSGEELWAFLPPDMIAKLPLLLAADHQFYVDGTAMVRDVWVDGTANALGTASSANDRKEAKEFHTVAVVGERRGGTHWFALDVTDATTSSASPKFLWLYPQPNDRESLDFGETYSDYLPRAPPIGPVRIAADSNGGAATTDTPTMTVGNGTTRYHERWIVFLNGGLDPNYLRGRGVHMVDVWTGKELFDFSYSTDTTSVKNALRFPVPAVVGMTGWGAAAKRASGETNDYFFDTATFGDAGGQLWTLRFHVPGTLDTAGRATNWAGGRTFQMGSSSSACKLCAGQPFFYMTANIPLPTNGAYRVYAGTGDRFNLLDLAGGTCGPDNIRACVLKGCTVTLDETSNVLESAELGTAQRGLTQVACGTLTPSQPATDGAPATCVMNGKSKIVISACPAGGNATNATTKDVQVACTNNADGYQCTRGARVDGRKLTDLSNAITLGNMFYSLLVFEDSGSRAIFDDQTAADGYDADRLFLNETGLDASKQITGTWTTGIVPIAATATNPTLATADSKGWVLYYNHDGTVTADAHTYNVSWMDERTSSGSSTLGGIYWNTIQPASGEVTSTNGNCDAARCGNVDARRVATKYAADVETGGIYSRFKDPLTGLAVRSMNSALLVPTQSDQPTVFVNQSGQLAVGLTAVNPERGATNVGMTDAMDPTLDYGFIEVSKPMHACRHAASDAAAVCR